MRKIKSATERELRDLLATPKIQKRLDDLNTGCEGQTFIVNIVTKVEVTVEPRC